MKTWLQKLIYFKMKIKITTKTPSRLWIFEKSGGEKIKLCHLDKKRWRATGSKTALLGGFTHHLRLHPAVTMSCGFQGTICAVGGNRNKMTTWPKMLIYDHSWHNWIWLNHHQVHLKSRSSACEIELLTCNYITERTVYLFFSTHLQLYLHRIGTTQSFCCKKK